MNETKLTDLSNARLKRVSFKVSFVITNKQLLMILSHARVRINKNNNKRAPFDFESHYFVLSDKIYDSFKLVTFQ